jgi:LuxR family maltose regulon positive regulatory protein
MRISTGSHRAPVWSHKICRRPRLEHRLDDAIEHTLTLVCAPPGSGKTALVSDWISERPALVTAWVTVDHRNSDGDQLIRDVAGRLAGLGILDGPTAGQSEATSSLLDRLEQWATPPSSVVVVIDDAHEISDARVWRDLDRMIYAAPPWLRWVVLSRAEPPLRVERLRLAGRLSQLHAADLAFDDEEGAALMAWFGLTLSDDEARQLVTWSEGWAAALCLAARAMRQEAPRRVPWECARVGEAFVLDFLVQEVLDRLRPADRRFLLTLCVADLITPALAMSLTHNAMAGHSLRRLERSGTFLLEVDPTGSRYRFHGLMAEMLRARLNEDSTAEFVRLTTIAAEWYAENGLLDEAERHAARAGASGLLAELRAARCVDHLVHTGSLLPWSRMAVRGSSWTAPLLDDVMVLESVRRRQRPVTKLNLAARSTDTHVGSNASVTALDALARIELSRWDPMATACDWSARGGEELAAALGRVGTSAESVISYVVLREAEAVLVAAETARARRLLERLAFDDSTVRWVQLEAESLLAVLDVANGDSSRISAISRRVADRDGAGDDGMWLRLGGAIAHGLRGEQAGLRSRCDAITAAANRPCSWLFELCRRMLIGSVASHSLSSPPVVDPAPAGLPTQVALALGIVETVDRDGVTSAVGGPLESVLATSRRGLAEGSVRRLESRLSPWRGRDISGEHLRSAVELHVVLALVDLHHEREREALESIERAIELAAPAGLWGPFVMHGAALHHVLERYAWKLGAGSPAAVELLDALRTQPAPMSTILTERERAVLHYLPSLMSNEEIAAELLISVNTVKTHLKAIYRKLGVERRRDALLRARQIELL